MEQGGELEAAANEIPVNMSVIRGTIGPGESTAWAGKSLDTWKVTLFCSMTMIWGCPNIRWFQRLFQVLNYFDARETRALLGGYCCVGLGALSFVRFGCSLRPGRSLSRLMLMLKLMLVLMYIGWWRAARGSPPLLAVSRPLD